MIEFRHSIIGQFFEKLAEKLDYDRRPVKNIWPMMAAQSDPSVENLRHLDLPVSQETGRSKCRKFATPGFYPSVAVLRSRENEKNDPSVANLQHLDRQVSQETGRSNRRVVPRPNLN